MKYLVTILSLWTLFVSCNSTEGENREQQVVALEDEMIGFFQETLEKNFGRNDAVDVFVRGMMRFDYNYQLEVDRKELWKINKKLYDGGWMFSYFFDNRSLIDSCNVCLFVPEGMPMSRFMQSDKYRKAMEEVKQRREDGGYVNVSIVSDSVKYVTEKKKISGMVLPFLKESPHGFTYWQRELARTSHPALQKLRETEKVVGMPPFSLVWGMLSENAQNICSDFSTNRDVQLYLTLYFWNYLCHFGNFDFHSGKSRAAILAAELRNSL